MSCVVLRLALKSEKFHRWCACYLPLCSMWEYEVVKRDKENRGKWEEKRVIRKGRNGGGG